MIQKYNIALSLLQIKAIKLSPQNPFTWASGIKSPIYCDNRITLSYPEVRNEIQAALRDSLVHFGQIEAVSAVATAGIAHGAILADRTGLPFSYVRSSPKSHGRQNLIEGEIPVGKNVLVIEDLISTGGSSLEAVQVLKDSGCIVAGVLAIFDYGFDKAKQNFARYHCPYHTLTHYGELIRIAGETGYISPAEMEILNAWNQNPETWYQTHFSAGN